MDTIKVGTLNIQNSKINRDGGIKDGIDNTTLLADHIESNDYYLLGTQELTRKFSNKLSNNLKNYKLYGDYRYGSSKLVKCINGLEAYNESNAIITKQKVAKNITYRIPWFPSNPKDLMISLTTASIIPRVATLLEIIDKDLGVLFAINTHLDYQLKSIQIKQLKKLCDIIKDISTIHNSLAFKSKFSYLPFILTGDFNMEVGIDSNFDEFIEELNKLGLKRVDVNDKTNDSESSNQTAIDHIFIPSAWDIEDAGLINDDELSKITDHKGVYAKVKVK